MEGWIAALCGVVGILVTKIFDIVLYEKRAKKEDKNELISIKDDISSIKSQLKLNEKDALRTQLMVMIKDYPTETTDILRLAEYYFKRLKGNWVLTDIFSRWASENNIVIPNWLNMGEKDEQ